MESEDAICCGLWEHGTGNDMSIIENVFYSTRDAVTSGVSTFISGVRSLFGGESMKESSFDYSSGQRTMVNSPFITTGDKLKATGNAFLGVASLIPGERSTTGLFAKNCRGKIFDCHSA